MVRVLLLFLGLIGFFWGRSEPKCHSAPCNCIRGFAQKRDGFCGLLQLLLVLFWCLVIARHMHLDVLSFNLLHGCFLVSMVLPVLIELWETGSHIVNEKLRQLLVRLNDKAEKFAVIVVYNTTKLFLEWEWL